MENGQNFNTMIQASNPLFDQSWPITDRPAYIPEEQSGPH
jgi:hypothetical protein